MSGWTKETLRALDLKYAEQGLHLHQRSFRAALEILGSTFVMGVTLPRRHSPLGSNSNGRG